MALVQSRRINVVGLRRVTESVWDILNEADIGRQALETI